MEATHLAAVPDPRTKDEHVTILGDRALSARAHLIEVARHADLAFDSLAAHKARAAIVLIDELLGKLCDEGQASA